MEQIITNLLAADNNLIQQATGELTAALNRPETIPELCELVVSSQNSQIRQYSAVLLRKRMAKLRNWQIVPQEQRQAITQGMLKALMVEPEKSVRNAVTQFIGILAKHEFEKNKTWTNDVLKFIFENCASSDPNLSELGSATLSILTDTAPDQFLPHLEAICNMFTAAMMATEASGNMATPVIYNILVAMSNLVPFIDEQHNAAKQTYQNMIPYITKALQGFALQDAEKFVRAFDILENIAENLHALITPHLKLLVDFSLEIASAPQIDGSVRVKTISFLGWIVRLKKKVVIKLKLIEPIIVILFNLMATAPDIEDEEEEYFVGSSEHSNPMTCATQTMDILALNVPPEKLIPPLLSLLEPALAGTEPLPKKAAYLCMAVIAEGCSESICSKYLRPLLDCVKNGITDSNAIVRNAALFALGQFAEHLQPEISQYADEILPILFQFLHQLCLQLRADGKEPKHIDRMFYALETFCENLENELVPHLPNLMERLFESLNPNNSVHLRELSLSAVSAAATAAKSNMVPYFPQMIEILRMYLIKTDDEDIKALQPQAIDTLAAIARTIGKENFLPLSVDSMNFGLALLEDCKEPELKRSCYNLFASIAEVMNQEIASALPKIVGEMIESVNSSEGEGVIPDLDGGDGDSDDDANQDDDDIDIEQSDEEDGASEELFAVENAFLDEKEEAIIALRELAIHSGPAFAPYIQNAFESVYKVICYPQEDIRKAACEALTQFIVTLHQLKNIEGVRTALGILIPKLSEIIRTDEDRLVVITALEAFNELLGKLKSVAVPLDGHKDAIFECILDVLNGKVACQFDEPSGDDEQEESEYDEAIIETAGDIIPRFGLALEPAEFAMYFGRIFNFLTQKIEKSRKKDDADSQRAFAIGVLSECFGGLKERTSTWLDTVLPILLAGVQDRNDQVRNNSVYGLGELVINADEYSYAHYPQILQALSIAVAKEQDAGTLDNICGALARLIITNSNLVPLKEVLPVFIQYLPLRQDFEENLSVFKCLHVAYQQGHDFLVELMERIIVVALQVLRKKEYNNDETRDYIYNFVKQIRQDFPDKFNDVINSDAEIAAFVQNL